MTTKIQANRKCHCRASDSQRLPGIVSHEGKVAATISPLASREAPNNPVVSKSWPSMRVTPVTLSASSIAPTSSTGARPEYDECPQYSAGWALKMLRPLMNNTVSAITLIQCMMRTAAVCR